MAGGLNLHDVVRGAIPALHPDETVDLVQCVGRVNVRGVVQSNYVYGGCVQAQIQSFKSDDLQAMAETARTEIQRKCYLYSETVGGVIPQGIVRTLERGGDFLRRADGTYWLVAGMVEDFSGAGWVAVRIVQQITVPDGVKDIIAQIYPEPEPDPEPEGDNHGD